MPPFIAVTTSISPGNGGRPDRATLNGAYLRAIQRAGGVPVMLAPQFDQGSITVVMATSSGLLLTGGGDIFPGLDGQEQDPATSGVSVDRDRMEVEALGLALERGLPVLALCRGMQMLNVVMGGSLIQDLPSQRPSHINHAQTVGGAAERNAATHDVRTDQSSRLASILGPGPVRTNSMHHQAVDALGAGLVAAAWAEDGIVEGVEMPGEHWVLGVQWHPEELAGMESHADRLFAAFLAACAES